ncbi:MAG TPA: hypothetical protein VI298_15980 [Geobacteraceae bacterium]
MSKILLVSDGIIVLTAVSIEVSGLKEENVGIAVTEYGAKLQIDGNAICLPVSVLDHLEQAEATNIHFYESDPYALVASYKGNVTLDRDEVLKVKGAWEYQAPHQKAP